MSVVGTPNCSGFDPGDFSFDEKRDFNLETGFESDVLKVYKYTGSAALNSNKCYAVMAMLDNYSDNNYIAGTTSSGLIRPDYVTDRDGCNSKDGSGGNVGGCAYGGQGDYVTHAFLKVFPPN